MERDKKFEIITDAKGTRKEIAPSSLIICPDKKIQTPTNNTWLSRIIAHQAERKSIETSQDEATVRIKTRNKYIGIFFTGDWHFGSDKVDYELWDKHQSLVLQNDGMYEAIVGDERDNFVNPKFKTGLYEGVLNPEEQALYMKEYMEQLNDKNKIIARVTGNHDFWTWEGSGINFETFWYKGMKSPLLRNGGFVHLETNKVPYEIYMHHGQSVFNSNFNPNHATRRAYEMQGSFDVGVLGHKHVSEVAHGYKNSDSKQHDLIMIRSGTYKTEDQYARSKQLGKGQPPGATVLFSTSERHMMAFAKLEDAVEVMNKLNR